MTLCPIVDTCSFIFIIALFIIDRNWKCPRCPSPGKWIMKMCYTYTMGYYSAVKKNNSVRFVSKWMELETIILSEVILTNTVFSYMWINS